jgi:hypothetical protein
MPRRNKKKHAGLGWAAGLLMLFAAPAGARAADLNVPPVLPDPVPDSTHLFPPAMATAGTADPGRALAHSPVTAQMLAGQGSSCTPISPCAVDSPPVSQLGPVVSAPKLARSLRRKPKTG